MDTLPKLRPRRRGIVIKYVNLPTREQDHCRAKAVKLARLLSKRAGRVVTCPEAIRFALTEALWKRRNRA